MAKKMYTERDRAHRRLQRRRLNIAKKMHQLKVDLDFYNANSGEEPIVLVFDMTDDMLDRDAGMSAAREE